MNKNINRMLIFVLVMIMMLVLVGCASNHINSPEDAIKNAYGDTQFRISFDSTSLENPLTDMFYTANNMPVLPTPTKVGFVFAGWFFDASLTEPCDVQSGDLLWKMKNVTLYPKWEEEKIVNNGTYEIEYNAKIIDETIVKGTLADGYQEWPNDIITSETYIEKNNKGIYLRIQYDNRVRGPVLGSSGADADNFSKMTYTITEDDNRIDKDISIQDRTNTIQTIYYNLQGMNVTDTITFHVEYYNWKMDVVDDLRYLTTVRYDVEFNIARFIGFDQAFVNPEGRLEDGIYVVPTHYTGLDKTLAMLDMFNPVYAYIQASGGKYTLYKPLNTYNNDFPEVTPELFPLRSSGYAREFACFPINQQKRITQEAENDFSGATFIPELMDAKEYLPLTYEFHADTGRYYYVVNLGNTLDNDLVFIGGSSGFMESMMSFPFGYRRLTLDYKSMVRIVDWDYKPLKGNEYKFKDRGPIYLGSTAEFNGSNIVIDLFKQYKHLIDMTNVFFTRTASGDVNKIFNTKMTISVDRQYRNPSETRGIYSFFDINYSAFGYDPISDGDLYARDLSFVTHTPMRFSNSAVNRKMNGKSCKIGETINLKDVYRHKVASIVPASIQFKAFAVDDNLNIVDNGTDIDNTFVFSNNVAVLCTSFKSDNSKELALIYLVEGETPNIKILNGKWTLDENGIYKTDRKFETKSFVDIPEILYTYYGDTFTTKGMKKYFDELKEYSDNIEDLHDKNEKPRTDFTLVSAWKFSKGIYTAINLSAQPTEPDPNDKNKQIAHDFIMGDENVRVMVQLRNQFNEFEPIMLEFEGVNAGYYTLKMGDTIIAGDDITYKGTVRNKIKHNMINSYHIENEFDINKIPTHFDLSLVRTSGIENNILDFQNGIVYLKHNTIKISSISEIWNIIKNENYAVISLSYKDEYGDSVEYKAEYNFRINNKIADEYLNIGENVIIFNGEKIKVNIPVMSGYDYTILGRGAAKLYKKYGESYKIVDREDGSFSSYYYGTFEFFKSGTYLICWEFNLLKDENGDMIFDAVDPNAEYTYVKFNICQEIEVLDKNSEATLTYATDKFHPFNQVKKQELIANGYIFSEDAEYQYMSVPIRGNEITLALDSNVLNTSDYFLFGWGTKEGKLLYKERNQVQDIILEQKTLRPILYAIWNVPIKVELTYDFGGNIFTPYNGVLTIMRKDPNLIYKSETGKFYINSFFEHLPKECERYEIYGWEADKPIFETYVNIDGHSVKTYTNVVRGGYKIDILARESFKLKAIFKKSGYISYDAVKGEPSQNNKVELMNSIKYEYNIFVNDKLREIVSLDKMNELKNLKSKDINLTFRYWVSFDNLAKKWVKIDLDTFVLEDRFANDNGKIMLRAVFG